jgi:hypothetical protein
MLRRVALVRTDVSKELSTFFIRAIRTGELGTTLAITSNRRTLRRNTKWIVLFRTARGYCWHFTITFVSTFTSSLPFLDSGFQLRTFDFLCVSELSAPYSSSSQQLIPWGLLTEWLLTKLFCLEHRLTDRMERAVPLLRYTCCVCIYWGALINVTQPLPSNCRRSQNHYLTTAVV